MKKRIFSFLVVCFLFLPTLTLTAHADVIMPPYIPGSDGFPIFLLIVGLIIALIVGSIILVRFLKNRNKKEK